ncbi:HIT family protein [Terribacillus sp. AE2B 122]|uniref:HIT family protein n=1 Tax=Terribacillus sp. AE2B 122 TaxID=1331902 RepID=UPI00158305B4|nr:HIT family protein [Terribacillus sp. AE2B 122]
MHEKDCIFCKIAAGELPSAKVYEDDHVLAFMDIGQVTKGHTLIIPKTHTKNIYETPPEVAQEVFARVPRIANAIKEAFQPAGLNVLSNAEAVAGQTVFHLHVHLIPRYGKNDGFHATFEQHDNIASEHLGELAEKISSKIQ